MSHSYRKERYSSSRYPSSKAQEKEGWIKVIIIFLVLIGCFFIIAYLWQQSVTQKEEISSQELLIIKFEQELGILRTLNPYRVDSNEILAKAVESIDLYPGWIARVYPIPEQPNSVDLMKDLGSFVMNETRFSMSSHKRYGIPQLNKSMYRLNGLYPNHKSGRLQVAVELYLAGLGKKDTGNSISKICSCYVRIDINEKRVIDKKIHMVTRYEDERMISGDIELPIGLYPISAMLYCDENSDFSGEDIQVSISFRNSSEYHLTTSRHSIFHIYKPEHVIAKL